MDDKSLQQLYHNKNDRGLDSKVYEEKEKKSDLSKTEKLNLISVFETPVSDFLDELIPKYKKAYVVLDRRYARTNVDISKFIWTIEHNKANTTGSTYMPNKVRIKRIKIFDFGIIAQAPNSQSQHFLRENIPITVCIEELQSQAFIHSSGYKYHFIGTPLQESVTGGENTLQVRFNKGQNFAGTSREYRSTYNNGGIFTFKKPILVPDKFTLKFGYPFQLVKFRDPYFTITGISYNGFEFRVTISETLEYKLFGDGMIHEHAYIENFNTDDPDADADAIKLLNRKEGFRTYVSGVTPPTIRLRSIIGYDVLFVFPDVLPLTGNIISGKLYFAAYNFRINLEVDYINDE